MSRYAVLMTALLISALPVSCSSGGKETPGGRTPPPPDTTPPKTLNRGEAFLEQNSKKEGVVVTASGLQYLVLRKGEGRKPGPTDRVTVHYRGTLIDGTEFDSSHKRGQPATFGLNQVIRGWTEGLQLMRVGGKHRLFIPSNLAYGKRGAGNLIGPDETLIFDVELLAIE